MFVLKTCFHRRWSPSLRCDEFFSTFLEQAVHRNRRQMECELIDEVNCHNTVVLATILWNYDTVKFTVMRAKIRVLCRLETANRREWKKAGKFVAISWFGVLHKSVVNRRTVRTSSGKTILKIQRLSTVAGRASDSGSPVTGGGSRRYISSRIVAGEVKFLSHNSVMQ